MDRLSRWSFAAHAILHRWGDGAHRLVILVVVLAMRVRIGLGTLLNIAIIGPATDTTLWLLDEPDSIFVRWG